MRKPEGPCLKCKDRVAENPETGAKDCHGKCERYQAYREEVRLYHEMLYQDHGMEMAARKRPWLNKKTLRAGQRREREQNNDHEE